MKHFLHHIKEFLSEPDKDESHARIRYQDISRDAVENQESFKKAALFGISVAFIVLLLAIIYAIW